MALTISDLVQVSNNPSVNSVIKGLYCSDGFDLSQYSSLKLRKGFYATSSLLYVNQVTLIQGQTSFQLYTHGYSTQTEALRSLDYFILKNNEGVNIAIIMNWDAVPTGETIISIAGTVWADYSNIANNVLVASEMVKRHEYLLSQSPQENFPATMNNRISFVGSDGDVSVINSEENKIINTKRGPSIYRRGVENIIIEDKSLGRHAIFETSNTIYGGINIVKKRVLNPYYEEIRYRNASFVESPNGINKRFHLPDFLCSQYEVDIYVNGLRKKLGRDYTVYPQHNLVVFNSAPSASASIVVDYTTKKEHYKQDLSFEGVSILDTNSGTSTRAVYELTDFDTGELSNNNHNYDRYGFRQMIFCTEGWASGNKSTYKVEIVDNPVGSGKALHFKHGIVDTNSTCSRIESQVSKRLGVNKITLDVDVFFPNSMNSLGGYGSTIDWLTLMEFWEGRSSELVGVDQTSSDTERKITINMVKLSPATNQNLYFQLSVEDVPLDLSFEDPNKYIEVSNVKVPINTANPSFYNNWFTIHLELIPGGETTGGVKMIVTDNGGAHDVFGTATSFLHVRTICQRQTDGNALFNPSTLRPVYEDFCPMKLYTSDDVAKYMNESGRGSLQVYFKNYHLDCECAIMDE